MEKGLTIRSLRTLRADALGPLAWIVSSRNSMNQPQLLAYLDHNVLDLMTKGIHMTWLDF